MNVFNFKTHNRQEEFRLSTVEENSERTSNHSENETELSQIISLNQSELPKASCDMAVDQSNQVNSDQPASTNRSYDSEHQSDLSTPDTVIFRG